MIAALRSATCCTLHFRALLAMQSVRCPRAFWLCGIDYSARAGASAGGTVVDFERSHFSRKWACKTTTELWIDGGVFLTIAPGGATDTP